MRPGPGAGPEAMRDLAAAGARDVCVLDDDGAERRVPADQLRAGQRFVVRPGERIAADGEVVAGQSAGGPLDDDRGVGSCRRRAGRPGDRRHDRADRTAHRPRRPGRQGHPARPPGGHGRAGAGRQGGHPAARGPDLLGVCPRRAGLLGAHPRRVAAGGRPGRARVQRGARGADHRLPVRPGPGHPRGPGGGVRRGHGSASSSRGTRRWNPPARSTRSCWTRREPSPPGR